MLVAIKPWSGCPFNLPNLHAHEMHAVRYTSMRCTLVRCTPVRYTLARCTPVRYTLMRHTPIIRYTPMRYTPTEISIKRYNDIEISRIRVVVMKL